MVFCSIDYFTERGQSVELKALLFSVIEMDADTSMRRLLICLQGTSKLAKLNEYPIRKFVVSNFHRDVRYEKCVKLAIRRTHKKTKSQLCSFSA